MYKYCSIIIIALFLITACYQLPDHSKPEVDPNTAFNFYSKAQNEYLEGKYDEAMKNIETAIKLNPFIAQFYHLEGNILDRKGKYADALIAYRQTLKIRSNNPEIYEKMGSVASKLGNFNEAIQFHKKALAQSPEKIELNLNIAENYYWLKYFDLALNFSENYRKKADLGKRRKHPEYHRILANIRFAKNNYPEAKKLYETYFSMSGSMREFEARALLHSYNELGEADNVYDFLMKKASPVLSKGDIHFFRGLYYYQTKNTQDARTQMQMALKEKTTEVDVYLYLGRIYYAEGEIQKAMDLFKQYRTLGGKTIIGDVPM